MPIPARIGATSMMPTKNWQMGRAQELLVRIAANVLPRVPAQIIQLAAATSARSMKLTGVSFHQAAAANVAQVLGLSVDHPDVQQTVSGQLATQFLNMQELLRLERDGSSTLLDLVAIDPVSQAHLELIRENGKGAVLFTAHLGGFDLVMPYLHQCGFNVIVLTAPTVNRHVFNVMSRLRTARSVIMIEPSLGNLRNLVRIVPQGAVVGLAADRNIAGTGRDLLFFGKKAPMPAGAIWLAHKTGAPLVGVFAIRQNARYKLSVEEPQFVETTASLEDAMEKHMPLNIAAMERHISAALNQWVMFQPVWPPEPR